RGLLIVGLLGLGWPLKLRAVTSLSSRAVIRDKLMGFFQIQ
uniref:Uncharacterized protein n=1 Tax=Amphimedon queenslandica TaxID=400682 RepID=A0A1X7V574_AMPQE